MNTSTVAHAPATESATSKLMPVTTTTAKDGDIRLPSSLKPTDGRFGSGPARVRQGAVDALGRAAPTYLGTSHRQPAIRSMVRRLREGLADMFSLPDDYEIALGNGGAAFFWDIAVLGLIERRSQHFSFGEFSSRFADIVGKAPHLEKPVVIESPVGTHPEAKACEGVDVYALTHNETSTGVAMEVRRPIGADDGALVLVDATSAAGGLRVSPDDYDVYYFAPEKCFGSDGGLWTAILSPRALERVERIASTPRWMPPSLNLAIALENSRADQTYNTPALATLFLFVNQVEWFCEQGGLEWAAQRCDSSASVIYEWAEASEFATPFVAERSQRSHVNATVDLDASIDAARVSAILRQNGILDTESYRALGRNQLRIGLFPAIPAADVAVLTQAIDYVVSSLR